MFKVMRKLYLLFFLSLFSCVSDANSFSEADAFAHGDSLAMRDNDTGLTWLDFGINNGQSFNSVLSELDSVYKDWRLPTEDEVFNLWKSLVANNEATDMMFLFETWGSNVGSEQGMNSLSWGFFLDNDGYLGALSIIEKSEEIAKISIPNPHYLVKSYVELELISRVVDRKYDGSSYYPFNADGITEISTLVVKKRTYLVETSSLTLILTSLVFIVMRHAGFANCRVRCLSRFL